MTTIPDTYRAYVAARRDTSIYEADRDRDPMFFEDEWLTDYALACGYREQFDLPGDRQITLWQEGCYHVRVHDYAKHERALWDAFDTLEEARQFFAEYVNKVV